MKAMILAAGFGTRLWPLTEDRTKPAIPFLNRPLIWYSVEYLASHGIRDVIVNLHHQPESIRQVLGDGSQLGVQISYSHEQEILGTSGALDLIRKQLVDDDFVVINGKIITDIDLQAVITEHRVRNALATLVLKENKAREHFSIVEIDERQWITRFAGFPEPLRAVARDAPGFPANASAVDGRPSAPLMFTGIQVLSPRIFEYIPRNRFSHSTIDVYPQAVAAGEPVIAHISEAEWYETSTLDRYLQASLIFARKQDQNQIIGRRCVIENGARVEESVLWDDVVVGSGASIRRCILGDGVRVPEGAVMENAAVIRSELAAQTSSPERGEIIGSNLLVPIS